MAIDQFTMKLPAEIEPLESPPSSPILKAHVMTVSYQGPRMPTLRLKGRWLDVAGFPVGTRVRVDVSPRRLIVEATEHESSASCAIAEALARDEAGRTAPYLAAGQSAGLSIVPRLSSVMRLSPAPADFSNAVGGRTRRRLSPAGLCSSP
jgi:hypothetical protein